MSFFDQAEAWAPLATMADAHREWHLNSGVPMGMPGCPQDACHAPDDYSDYDPADPEGLPPTIRCAHCKNRHHTVVEVRACSA